MFWSFQKLSIKLDLRWQNQYKLIFNTNIIQRSECKKI